MDTATHEPPKPAEGHHPATGVEVPPIDPEHDIDAPKTILWLSAAFVFVVVSLLVLAKTFSFAVIGQQYEKIDLTPPKELRALRSNEDYYLKKATPVGDADLRSLTEIEGSIEATTGNAIQAYVNK